jgi:NADH-quinone oxidoreductase subunit N
MKTVLLESLAAWWPEAILSIGGLAVLLIGAWDKRPKVPLIAAWGFVLAAVVALANAPVPPASNPFFGLILCDAFSLPFRWLALGTVALVLLMIDASSEVSPLLRGECVGLVLFIAVGLMLMAEANHLLTAYLALELVSLSSYVLVGFVREARSAEASLKYLLFGALSSGIMLFGMSLLFGLTGSLEFARIAQAATGGVPQLQLDELVAAAPLVQAGATAYNGAFFVAIVLMLAGLAFKISMVPFHMWTPDVYEGAPLPIAALLSVGPKAAGLALLVRMMAALSPAWPLLEPLIMSLTILTMTLGNVVALAQTNMKRLLAYSTIGQVGYLLMGFASNTRAGVEALQLYLVAYLFMNMGAFACAGAVLNDSGSESLEACRGLARRAPGLALAFAIFLLSLAGIPPLVGFLGKYLLFGSALHAHQPVLAVAAVINSVIATYYYANIIRLMYFTEPSSAAPVHPAWPLRVALGICAAMTVILGLFPNGLLAAVSRSSIVSLL